MSEKLPSRQLSPDRYAFFFDVDGTLAEIQPRPELVFVPGPVHNALARLQTRCPATAVVSGRPVEQLDELLAPLTLPAAGVHGAERRDAEGEWTRLSLDAARRDQLLAQLREALAPHPDVFLENKQVAFALHYRQAPALEGTVRAIAEAACKRFPELALQPGKCVFELKPKGASKGEVIRRFMAEPPFAGRVPVFLGDDLTDEAGFEVVAELNGIAIKVGEGDSVARYRLESVTAVGEWLDAVLAWAASGSDNERWGDEQ